MGRLGRAQLNDPHPYRKAFPQGMPWPLPNLCLGVTAEDQKMWDLRRRDLEETPAARRFVSMEPLLGPIDAHLDEGVVDWVIVGGESGKHGRQMHPDWARSLRDQCVAAQVPFFFKQWGEWAPVPVEDNMPGRPQMVRAGDVMIDREGNQEVIGKDLTSTWESFATPMRRVGKKAAGRLLDGREWNEQPQPFATGGVVKAGPYLAGERGGEFQP
jgi:protein gp37